MKKRVIRTLTVLCAIAIGIISAGSLGSLNAVPLDAEHTIPQTGLVAYWNLDEGTGTVAAELTGTMAGRNLAVQGATKWVDGKYGKAFYFDGSTVLAMDGAKAIKVYNLTVAFWAKIDDFPASDTGANMLVVNSDLAALDKGAFDFGFFGKGLYAYVVNSFTGGTGDRVSQGVDISAQIKGKWQHFAVVYDTDEGKEFAKIYLNGSEVASSTLKSILGLQIKLGYPKTAAYKKCALNFGGYTDTAGVVQRAIKGAMDDIAIYDRALGADEIGQLAGISPQQSSVASSAASSSSKSSSAVASSSVSAASSAVSSSAAASGSESAVSSESGTSDTGSTQISSVSSGTGSLPGSSQASSAADGDGGSNTLMTVIIIAAAVLLAGGIGWFIVSRKK
ncbi:MAG: LamG domain-containing protein [Saccharofermentanales bacterium]